MNSAVGGDGPPWLCIDSLDYDKKICSADMPLGFNGQRKHGAQQALIVRSPNGISTRCESIAAAAKFMHKNVTYLCDIVRAHDIYVLRDGWQVVKVDA
jgi:hypothetical protein